MIVSVPNMIIWVIGAPLFAFFILYKNRDHLDQSHVKQYYLILYQGLKDKVFYWEFINTIRKTSLLAFNTVLSVLSIQYRLFLSFLLLMMIIRIQIRLKPYKLESNNRIELRGVVAGTIIIYCGILFEVSADENYIIFETLALSLLLYFNISFIMDWIYNMLVSVKSENKHIKTIVHLFEMMLCIWSVPTEVEEQTKNDLGYKTSKVNIKAKSGKRNKNQAKKPKKDRRVSQIFEK